MSWRGRGYKRLAAWPLSGALFLAALVALRLGAVSLDLAEIGAILASRLPLVGGLVDRTWPASHEVILLQLRLPRVVLGALVGSSLALSGLTFQGLFRNPMADPFIIGTSSGAALGAVLAMVIGIRFQVLGVGAVPAMAFAGALASVFIVYRLAAGNGKVPVMTLLLAGIAVGSFLSAVVSVLIVFSAEKVGQIVFWLMGGLAGADWVKVGNVFPYTAAGWLLLIFYARDLNALLLGEEPAQSLGIEVERLKRHLLATASVLTAAAVSVSGMIGFVGLITPHVVRLMVGPDNRLLVPLSAVAGAVFLLVTDTFARTAFAPAEIPAGVVTALFGGPFFIYLLRKRKGSVF